jgi:hypothetical protein
MAISSIRERFNRLLDTVESRWSLWAHGATLMASFSLPAWATWMADVFSQYAPLSWVVAGFCGVLAWAIIRLIWNWAYRIRIRAAYDARFIEHGGNFNPLDSTFERRRIYVNDFVLPSHPFIDGKTFIDCDIIGPANIYFASGNQANPIRLPIIDAVCLEPTVKFGNGFIFTNCIFRNCSFQRITAFVSVETYLHWKDSTSINWIGIPPSPEHVALRNQILEEEKRKALEALNLKEVPKQIEAKAADQAKAAE